MTTPVPSPIAPIDLGELLANADYVVLVKRYDTGSAQWGVHHVRLHFDPTNRRPEISNRAIGLYPRQQVEATLGGNERLYWDVLDEFSMEFTEGWGAFAELGLNFLSHYLLFNVLPLEFQAADMGKVPWWRVYVYPVMDEDFEGDGMPAANLTAFRERYERWEKSRREANATVEGGAA